MQLQYPQNTDLIAVRVSVKGCLGFGALQMTSLAHPNDSEEHAERMVQIDLEAHAQLSELLV